MSRWWKVTLAVLALVLFLAAQVGISYVRSSWTNERISTNCEALSKVRKAVTDAQTYNRANPLPVPSDAPPTVQPFVDQVVRPILDQVNANSRHNAEAALRTLRGADC